MKNKVMLFKTTIFLVVIGLSIIACDNGSTEKAGGQLTITNFRGSPGLTDRNWVEGFAMDDDEKVYMFAASVSEETVKGARISGNSITLNVYQFTAFGGMTPLTSDFAIYEGDLIIAEMDGEDQYYARPINIYGNRRPITFVNGCATINFRTQMEEP